MTPASAASKPRGRRPRRLLASAAALLAGAGLVFGASASFSTKAVNPSNRFSAGTLSISDSEDAAAILTATGLKPAGHAVGRVEIQNTGSVAGTLTLTRPALDNSDAENPLSTQLALVIADCGDPSEPPPACDDTDPSVYRGTLAEMTGASALGTYSPDEEHLYEFTLTLDPQAGNAYQGDTSTATFRWDATQ